MTYLLEQLEISDKIVLGLDDFENDLLSGTLLLGCSSQHACRNRVGPDFFLTTKGRGITVLPLQDAIL